MSFAGLAILSALIIPIVAYGIYSFNIRGQVDSTREFFLHSSLLSEQDLAYTFAGSWMSIGNVIVVLLILSLVTGIANLWTVITWPIGFIIFARHSRQIKRMCGTSGTLHHFLGDRFQMPAFRKIASIFTIFACLGVFALELIVVVGVLQAVPIFQGSTIVPIAASIVITIFIASYTSLGGFYAVVKTDKSQFALIIIGVLSMLIIVLTFIVSNPESALSIPKSLWNPTTKDDFLFLWKATGPSFFIGLFFFQLLLQIGDMGSWQRVIAAKEVNSPYRSLLKVSWWMFLLWFTIALVGILLWSHPDPDGLFPDPNNILFTQAEPLPSLLGLARQNTTGLIGTLGMLATVGVAAGLVTAMLSTCDTYIIVIMQTLAQDLLFVSEGNQEETEDEHDKKILRFSRRFLFLVALAGLAVFWLSIPLGFDLASLVFVIFATQCTLVPAAVLALSPDLNAAKMRLPSILGVIGGLGGAYYCGYLAAYQGKLSFAYWAPAVAILIPIIVISVTIIIIERRSPLLLLNRIFLANYPKEEEKYIANKPL